MNDSPLISVIIPVYNCEKYINDSVDSILRQTYKNIEVLIINDGSSDRTKKKLEKYIDNSKVKIIEQDNQGLVFTLNKAISKSSGKYIARMDADDVALPSRVEVQLDYLIKNELDIVGSWVEKFDGDGLSEIITYPESPADNKYLLLFKSSLAHPSVMMKRSVFNKSLYSNEVACEDYLLWCQFSNFGMRIGNVPEVLLRYRSHPNQVTSTKQKELFSSIYKVRISYASEQGMLDLIKKEIKLHKKGGYLDFKNVIYSVYNSITLHNISDNTALDILRDIYMNSSIKTIRHYCIYMFFAKKINGSYPIEFELLFRALLPFNRSSFIYQLIKDIRDGK